eukprot:TRINITY_DN17293_c0_g1_i1.p1 TRINITY_DN17293_c0_g1~~TRINITY_DN17293_c0_g1_i1.p1  ORF type:complete len:59 (-),score=4.86 TRINITY_DN17293_c0_g1_i1:27-203(-)
MYELLKSRFLFDKVSFPMFMIVLKNNKSSQKTFLVCELTLMCQYTRALFLHVCDSTTL